MDTVPNILGMVDRSISRLSAQKPSNAKEAEAALAQLRNCISVLNDAKTLSLKADSNVDGATTEGGSSMRDSIQQQVESRIQIITKDTQRIQEILMSFTPPPPISPPHDSHDTPNRRNTEAGQSSQVSPPGVDSGLDGVRIGVRGSRIREAPRASPSMGSFLNVLDAQGPFQGERVSRLQAQVREFTLSAPAENRTMDDLNKHIQRKADELQQIVWEVRYLDKAIGHVLNNRIELAELGEAWRFGGSSSASRALRSSLYAKHGSGSCVLELLGSVRVVVEHMVHILREHPAIFAGTLLRAGYMTVDLEKSLQATNIELCQALVFSLFGNCFTVDDEIKLLQLLHQVIEFQFALEGGTSGFVRNETFALSLLSTYMNYTYGKPYLISTFKDLILNVLQDDVVNLERDPLKKAMLDHPARPNSGDASSLGLFDHVLSEDARQTRSSSFGGLSDMSHSIGSHKAVSQTHIWDKGFFESEDASSRSSGDDARSSSHHAASKPNDLHDMACLFLLRITERLSGLPYGMRWVSKLIVLLSRVNATGSPQVPRHGDHQSFFLNSIPDSPSSSSSSSPSSRGRPELGVTAEEWGIMVHVVFENFFIPAIIRPEHHGLVGLVINHRARNNLIQIAQAIRGLVLQPATLPEVIMGPVGPVPLADRVRAYFADLPQVEEPAQYFTDASNIAPSSSSSQSPATPNPSSPPPTRFNNIPAPQTSSPPSPPLPPHHILVSSTDLVMLLELIYQNRQVPLPPFKKFPAALIGLEPQLAEVTRLIESLQPHTTSLQEGRKLLYINANRILPTFPTRNPHSSSISSSISSSLSDLPPAFPSSPGPPLSASMPSSPRGRVQLGLAKHPEVDTKDDAEKQVKLAKENLLVSLSVLNTMCGYEGRPLMELLQLQSSRNRSFEANILEAQLGETRRALSALPPHYRRHDFAVLIDEMAREQDQKARERDTQRRASVFKLDQLTRHLAQIQAQKRINVEFLTNLKVKEFREHGYSAMQDEFVDQFSTRFPTASDSQSPGRQECHCQTSIYSQFSRVCDTCSAKASCVKEFTRRARNILPSTPWWGNPNTQQEHQMPNEDEDTSYNPEQDQDIDVAMHALERGLFAALYSRTFTESREDMKFCKETRRLGSGLTYKHMGIRDRFCNQVPWIRAQQELQRINVYKAPHDKMKCITDTWNIIFNYLKPLGEVGPDDFLPIMAFVIVKAQTPQFLSNLNFIENFTSLDELAEVWFMNIKSAVEIVREVVLGEFNPKGWQKGLVKTTRLRMDTLYKSMKRKEKEARRRSSMIAIKQEASPQDIIDQSVL
eukprot:TRINITY_DN3994_c0_g1_i5.p1 TRINITY_DN3994_c0_g1~~TRINITY_DN3994_c0_g1_i5.p1  ORF type:complete len:1302 (+),score=348.06 TRINITY_DN3994_c0_g1_i5:87-3992(+)